MAELEKVNLQRKVDGEEEQTLEDWRKAKKGACVPSCVHLARQSCVVAMGSAFASLAALFTTTRGARCCD